MKFLGIVLGVGIHTIAMIAYAEFDIAVGTEARIFTEKAFDGYRESGALLSQLDYSTNLYDNQSFDLDIIALYDELDDNRRFVNISELKWSYFSGQWEYRIGFDTIFWGVVESVNLVDVVNPRIIVEDPEGDSKFGQLMVNLRYQWADSTVDFYILPGFREVEYPAEGQLLSAALPIDKDSAVYESSKENERIDFAIRYATIFNSLDMALSHFSGNSREPIFESGLVPGGVDGVKLGLIPHYFVIDQTGLELQYLVGNTAYKMEGISRQEDGDRYTAIVGGLEYTQTGIFGTSVDVGWVAEYLFDDRGRESPGFIEHDYGLAARINFNDPKRTLALIKVLYDPHSDEAIYGIEGSIRLTSNITLSLDSQIFEAKNTEIDNFSDILNMLNSETDKLSQFNKHDYIQFRLMYYF